MASKSRQRGLAGRKREAAAVAKRAAETAVILARKDAERDAAVKARLERDKQLDGLGRNLTTREVIAVTEHLEEKAMRLRTVRRYMTEGPETRVHFTQTNPAR